MPKRFFLFAVVLAVGSLAADAAEARLWQDPSGRFSVEAEFVRQENGKVVLRRSDGHEINVALSRLSDADRRFLADLSKPKDSSKRPAAATTEATNESDDDVAAPLRYTQPKPLRVRVGLEVAVASGTSTNLIATFPVPMDWPEQKVTITETNLSPEVKRLTYRTLADGVRQAEFRIPKLRGGETASASITLDIERRHIEGPTETDSLVLPKKPSRDLRRYLGESPKIEIRHPEIVSAGQGFSWKTDEPIWPQIEAAYDWVREHVQPDGTRPLKGALAALRDKTGDCEERTSLFVAFCRNAKIPARSVWVPGHTYAEFYLEDASGAGYWFPCESLGPKSFGSMPRHQVVMQKGDNFKMSQKKKRQRYVTETLSGNLAAGSQPTIRPIFEFLDGMSGDGPPTSDPLIERID